MSLAEQITADFAAEAAHTRAMLDALPADRLAWKPHDKSMSAGQLAGHLAEMPDWLGAILEDEMDFAAMGDYQPFVPASKAELLERFERGEGQVASALDGRDDAFLATTWRMKMGDKVLMEAPKGDVIRQILLHHGAHHRGQLSVYLRLMDVPVPRTYGPTADHPEMG